MELSQGADPMQPTPQWMADHGGNFGPLTFAGEPWRMLTSMFLHYGALHIAMNMIGLIDGGRHVERMYGTAGFLALFLISGLVGSFATALRANVVSAGASGAIFGVFGAFGAFLFLHRDRLDKEQVKKQSRGLLIFLAYNIFFGMTAKGIDLVAHAGGLVAGFLVGIALEVGTDHGHSTTRRSLIVLVLGAALVFGGSLVVPRPNNPLAEFVTVETKLLGRWNEVVKQVDAETVDDAKLADIIETELLPPWRVARATYEKEAEGPLRSPMMEYLRAREEGWEIMRAGLREEDGDKVKAGMKRFAEGDAVLAKLKATN